MSDNLKNSIVSIVGQAWVVPLGIACTQFLQGNMNKGYILLVIALILLFLNLVLAYYFFGSARLPHIFSGENLLLMASLFALAVCAYLLVQGFNGGGKLGFSLYLTSLLSWSYLLSKLRKASNLRLLRSFLNENLSLMDSWVAARTNNEQGADFRLVNTGGCPIQKLVFTILPATPFWRAGFKLTDPNTSILPLRSDKSFLFHLGSTVSPDKIATTAYVNGDWISDADNTFDFKLRQPISVRLEVNENNFIKVFINGVLGYKSEEEFNSRIREKVYLVAWGDEHNFRVEFDGIGFISKK